jgi:hypothetical protein
MKKNNLIIRLQSDNSLQKSNEGVNIVKYVSSISPGDFIKLLDFADNKVNPRIAKDGRITSSIEETLTSSPELFWLKTKGILIATLSCRPLERNRFEIIFSEPDFEGIMDGGHNALAIASFITSKLFNVHFKTWAECKAYWDSNFEAIYDAYQVRKDEFQFSIPIEIITPNGESGSDTEFYDCISEICSARNNNVQLRESAKGNKEGKYDLIKEMLDEKFRVIWKTGESGNIKAEDVISVACLPLLFLQDNDLLPSGSKLLSKVSIYSQKSRCVDFFNELMEHESISKMINGKYVITDSYVKSSMALVGDSLRFFDQLFINFPDIYHRSLPGKFGRINTVDIKDTAVPFHSTDQVCGYRYPAAYFYPLFTGLTSLMEIDKKSKTVKWRVNPINLKFESIDCRQYISMLKMVSFEPQKVGKSEAFYLEAENVFANI